MTFCTKTGQTNDIFHFILHLEICIFPVFGFFFLMKLHLNLHGQITSFIEYFFQNEIDFFFFLMRQYRIFQTDTQCVFLHHIYFCLTQQVILQQTVSMKFCQNTAPVHIQQIFQCILFRQLKMFNDLDIHRMMWKQLSFQFTFQKIYFFFWQKSAASKVDTQRVSLSRCGNF